MDSLARAHASATRPARRRDAPASDQDRLEWSGGGRRRTARVSRVRRVGRAVDASSSVRGARLRAVTVPRSRAVNGDPSDGRGHRRGWLAGVVDILRVVPCSGPVIVDPSREKLAVMVDSRCRARVSSRGRCLSSAFVPARRRFRVRRSCVQ